MANRALEIQPEAASALFTSGLVEIARERPEAAESRAGDLRGLGFDSLAGQLEDSIRTADSRDSR
jgi:hypothetical protein